MTLVSQHLIDSDDSRYPFFLAFPRRNMQGGPVVVILDVGLSAMSDKQLADAHALLRVLREDIHDQMQGSIAIAVRLVHICATH